MTLRFVRPAVFGIIVGLASMLVPALTLGQTPAQPASRFAVSLTSSYLTTTSKQDWARWGIMLKPRVRVGPNGQIGLSAAYYFSNGADPRPSLQGADLYKSVILLHASYEYLIPLRGAVRPYFGFSVGPAFVTERNWGEPGPIRLLRDVSTTAGSFQLPLGALVRLSSDVQLDLGLSLQVIILEKQATLQCPFTLGVRVGRL